MTWLPRSWDGICLPGLLARLRIIGCNEAANTQFTPRGAHHDLALGDQWRQRQVVPILVIFNGRIPHHFASFGVQGEQVAVNGRQIHLVLQETDAAVGRV